MTNLDVLENKISTVKKYLTLLESYQKYSQNEIEDDINLKGALERYLYLAIQSTIDLAEGVISLKSLRKPSTMAENFLILNEQHLISTELKDQLVQMTGFRNIITHDYAEINFDIVYEVLKEGLKDIETFTGVVEKIEE